MQNNKEYLNIGSWELLKAKISKSDETDKCYKLGVRKLISPLDMYCYLKAKFGEPASKSTDGKWTFRLQAGDLHLKVDGKTREFHMTSSKALSDSEWQKLIDKITNDFSTVEKEMEETKNEMDKYFIFHNKSIYMREICETLYRNIQKNMLESELENKNKSSNITTGWNKLSPPVDIMCLSLSIMTPIIVEAYVNLLILMLFKKKLGKKDWGDKESPYFQLLKEGILERSVQLFKKCDGFSKKIKKNHKAYKEYATVVAKRNDLLHGNIKPTKEGGSFEEVYFDEHMPIFKEGGNIIEKSFVNPYEKFNQPKEVCDDYLKANNFIAYIQSCLKDESEEASIALTNNLEYSEKDEKVVSLLNGGVAIGKFHGLKYDDELEA